MKRALVAVTTVMTLGVVTIAAAGPASARRDPPVVQNAQVWHQAFERSGQDAKCVPPKELDIVWQENWDPAENVWTQSWEQWANHGNGGWVCVRDITWIPGMYWHPFD